MPVAIDLTRDETLPRYIIAVYGLDSTWKEHARCRGRGLGARRVWFQEDDHPGIGGDPPITGHQLAEMALGECAICPVQWECCSWAIEGEQNFTIFGAKAAERKWLRGPGKPGSTNGFLGDWRVEMEKAKEKGETARGMILRLRKEQDAAVKAARKAGHQVEAA